MKVYINGNQVTGSPREIAELLSLVKEKKPRKERPVYTPNPENLGYTIEEARILREKLERDPNYNPYPGVVPGVGDSVNVAPPNISRSFGAESDTGVQR